MIFVKIIWYSEGHQTKPAWDNVHIPQTNVFNVKQFKTKIPFHKTSLISRIFSFKLNVAKRKLGRYLQFIRPSVSFCLFRTRWLPN